MAAEPRIGRQLFDDTMKLNHPRKAIWGIPMNGVFRFGVGVILLGKWASLIRKWVAWKHLVSGWKYPIGLISCFIFVCKDQKCLWRNSRQAECQKIKHLGSLWRKFQGYGAIQQQKRKKNHLSFRYMAARDDLLCLPWPFIAVHKYFVNDTPLSEDTYVDGSVFNFNGTY